jgi:hypothetical protein
VRKELRWLVQMMELQLDGLLVIRSSARDHPENSNFDIRLEIYDAKLADVRQGELDLMYLGIEFRHLQKVRTIRYPF